MSGPTSTLAFVSHTPPWLIVDFPGPRRVLGWSLNQPGFVQTQRILWREVRNADLPVDLDVDAWLSESLSTDELVDADGRAPPVMITSHPLENVVVEHAAVDDVEVAAIATVGLSNAERVGGQRRGPVRTAGTINLAVVVSKGLTEAGLIEAMSVAVSARTVAVVDHGPLLPDGKATGTGTDCVAIAAPVGDERFAGLHTSLGEAVGRAAYNAVAKGVVDWMRDVPHEDAEP